MGARQRNRNKTFGVEAATQMLRRGNTNRARPASTAQLVNTSTSLLLVGRHMSLWQERRPCHRFAVQENRIDRVVGGNRLERILSQQQKIRAFSNFNSPAIGDSKRRGVVDCRRAQNARERDATIDPMTEFQSSI